jgi:hypothetical protein
MKDKLAMLVNVLGSFGHNALSVLDLTPEKPKPKKPRPMSVHDHNALAKAEQKRQRKAQRSRK